NAESQARVSETGAELSFQRPDGRFSLDVMMRSADDVVDAVDAVDLAGPPRVKLWRDRRREHVRAVGHITVGLHKERLEGLPIVRESLVIADEVPTRDRRERVVERAWSDAGFRPTRAEIM